jgi:hypothetical protein
LERGARRELCRQHARPGCADRQRLVALGTVFAVDVDKLPIAKNDKASAASVGFDLHFQALAKATLTALYGR